MSFSEIAEEMHAGAMDYEMAREFAEMAAGHVRFFDAMDAAKEAREAMAEARGNDGVRVPGWVEDDEMTFA